jgi:hypothetical protein
MIRDFEQLTNGQGRVPSAFFGKSELEFVGHQRKFFRIALCEHCLKFAGANYSQAN